MQSIVALAGVVGVAVAAVAPAYGVASSEAVPAYAVSSEAEAATILPVYGAGSSSSQEEAATISAPAYAAASSFACNPAHAYPAGQTCTELNGSLTLVTVSSSEAAKVSYTHVTETISTSAYVTVCPSPTAAPATLVYNTATYTITQATTITVSACANGCTVVKTVPIEVPQPTAAPSAPAAVVDAPPKPTTDVLPVVPGVSTVEESAKVVAPTPYASSPAAGAAAQPSTTLLAYKSQNATAGSYETAPARYTGAAAGRVGAGAFAVVAGIVAFL